MFKRWLMDQSGNIIIVNSKKEYIDILRQDENVFYTVFEHKPTEADIKYYIYGITE